MNFHTRHKKHDKKTMNHLTYRENHLDARYLMTNKIEQKNK